MRKLFPVVMVIMLLIIGCSGGNDPVAIAPSMARQNDASSSHMLWGLWQFIADPDKGTLDIVPLRSPEMHLNALPFLEPPAFVYLSLESLEFNGNIIDADIGLRHPFLGLDEFTGFDVSGILITNGSVTGFSDSDLVMAGPGDTRLLNPDGYARWWNPAEFPNTGTMLGYKDGLLGTPDSFGNYNSTVNAYKFFCDELTDPDAPVSDVDIESRCVFSAGMKNIRHYSIEIGNDGLIFNYAIDASWTFPNGAPPWIVPDDFPEEANRPEAWNFSVTEINNSLWNDGGGGSGGTLNLIVDVWDHYNAGLNILHAESPGNFSPAGPLGPVGGGVGYSTYEIDITSATPAEDSIDILLIAECEETGYQGLLTGKKVAAYFIHTAQVGGQGDMPPVAVAEIVTEEPWCPLDAIEFDASESYDPDGGNIVLYEWDFDGDGSYGDAYDSGTDVNPTKIYTSPGVYDVDVRVTDDEDDTDTLDEPLVLSVGGPTWVDDDAVPPYDGSFDNPWPTIQDGIDNLNTDCPGSGWVLVKDGTYTENITFVSNLTVEGYSTPAPLIISPNGSSANLVNMGGNSNTTIKHFQVKPRTSGNGISSSGQNVTVDDIEFLDNPGAPTCSRGVNLSSYSAGNVVNNVRTDGYHVSSAGFIYVRGDDLTITNCVILNLTFTTACSANVIMAYGSTSGNPDYLVAKNVIGHITFSQPFASTQWVTIMNAEYCGQGTVRNNLIFDIDNNLGDTGWTWAFDAYRATDATFEHNTISGISGPAWIYAFETSDYYQDPSGVTHRDHIITDLTAGIMNWRWAYLGRWGSDLFVDYSCAYNVGNSFRDNLKQGVGCVFSNPVFVDPTNDDYRVSDGSPCDGTAHDGTDMGAYGGSDPLTWLPD